VRDESIDESLYLDAQARRIRREELERRTKSEEEQARNRPKMNERSVILAHNKFTKVCARAASEVCFNW